HLIVELDGQEGAVKADGAKLSTILEKLDPTHLEVASDEESCEAIWDIRRSFSYSLRATGLTKMNHDVVVPRSRILDLARFSRTLQEETGYAVATFGHAGDGNLHVNVMVEEEELSQRADKVEIALDRLFQQVLAWGGVVTGEHGVGIARMPWMEQALGSVSVEIHRSMKDALDPQGILNPGKMIPGTDFA
ncbi:MAG: FAD-linked oxidase C-terminal domain-containing protein, partial [Verrucomicrobiota bacterium]